MQQFHMHANTILFLLLRRKKSIKYFHSEENYSNCYLYFFPTHLSVMPGFVFTGCPVTTVPSFTEKPHMHKIPTFFTSCACEVFTSLSFIYFYFTKNVFLS